MKRWLLLLPPILVVAFVSAVHWRTDRNPTHQAPLIRLWSIDMRRITRISISMPPAGVSGLWIKRDDGWVIQTSPRAGGSPAAPDGGLPLLLSRPQAKLVTEQPGEMSRFGLDAPQMLVQLTLDDRQRVEAHIGDRLPDGTGYYIVLAGARPVYSIDYAWFRELARPLATPR